MPAPDRTFYPYGDTPLGFEVGQRTDRFRDDWPVRSTASLYGRDFRTFTRVRQRALLVRNSLGFATLPSWMEGSARSFLRDSTEAVPFPDPSVFHALRDAMYGTPAALLLFSARFSRDASLSLSTGLTMPRTAYRAEVASSEGLTLSDGRTIRTADSLWDFMTAFDPICLASDDGSLILRNLDPPVLQTVTSTRGYLEHPRLDFPNSTYERDGVAAAVWDDARSISDDAYLPPVMSVSPVSAGFDLSCDSLWPNTSGPWEQDKGRVSYPVPLEPSVILSDVPQNTWPQITSPGFIAPVTPADGHHRLLLPGSPTLGGWELLSNGSSVGRANLCSLANGWDDAGEMIRLPRREREDDLVYAGRQQRLWMSAILNTTLGAATRSGQERTLSAALCRSVIVPTWDGSTFSLPESSTRVDALGYPDALAMQTMSLLDNTLSLLSATEVTCPVDLSSFSKVYVSLDDVRLREHVDYEIDQNTLVLAVPVAATDPLNIVAQGRCAFRLDQEDSPTLLAPEPLRASSEAWTGPLLISRGPTVRSCGSIKDTLLIQADRTVPTTLGRGIVERSSTSSWATPAPTNRPMVSPPFDLDMGAFS